MNLHSYDLLLIFGYLLLVAIIGFRVKKKATEKLDSYYLAGRNVPWWRFSARAFVGSMIASATILIGFWAKPTDKEILCRFYSRIRPFGVWGPIRRFPTLSSSGTFL